MKITLCGQDILLHHSGAALLLSDQTLVVSDLHLEKGSHFAKRGFFLPPYDSRDTLSRLLTVCEQLQAKHLIILGDCFHDDRGFHRLQAADGHIFDSLLHFAPVWIKGNHDGDFVPPGFLSFIDYQKDGLVFRHEAERSAAAGEVSGHFHPKVRIGHEKSALSRPCFVEDGQKLLMPAFGAYTGGLTIAHPQIANIFSGVPRIHLLGMRKLFSFGLQDVQKPADLL